MLNSISTYKTHALAALLALAALAAFAARPAHARVYAYPEPAYTKTSGNNHYFFHWQTYPGINQSANDYRYFLCEKTFQNGVVVEDSNGANGPSSSNCTGLLSTSAVGQGDFNWLPFTANTQLPDGQRYGICTNGYNWYDFLWALDPTTQADNCASTIIDRNAPQVSAGVDGDADVTRDPHLALSIGYQDATSPPWFGANGVASNWTCVSLNGPCQPSGAPDADCSHPQSANSKSNAFYCQADVSAYADGDWYFCAYSADAAMPDNPNGNNQLGATSNQANLSGTACGHVVLDRAAPSVTATASRINAPVGTLINFSGQASDPHGVQSGYDWDFGDNTQHASGTTATHTYTQAGTYQVKLAAKDNPGNTGVGTVTVTITPPAPHDDGNNNGNNSNGDDKGSDPGPGTKDGSVGVTPTPTQVTPTQVVQQSGGGPAQSTALGNLDVIAPKRFTAGRRTLLLALTPDSAGKLQVSMLRGAKIVASKGVVFGGGGTYALKLKVPAKIKPGNYQLKLSYTANGSSKAQTKTLKLKVVKGKKAKRGKVVVITHEGPSAKGIAASKHQPRRAH